MARGVAEKYVKHLLAQWALKINEHVQASEQEREVQSERERRRVTGRSRTILADFAPVVINRHNPAHNFTTTRQCYRNCIRTSGKSYRRQGQMLKALCACVCVSCRLARFVVHINKI